jgi:hypothetical protein
MHVVRNLLSALKPFCCLITILLAAVEIIFPSRTGLLFIIGLQVIMLGIMELESNQ